MPADTGEASLAAEAHHRVLPNSEQNKMGKERTLQFQCSVGVGTIGVKLSKVLGREALTSSQELFA
eukprot:2982149-Amphidinium_carterae.1